MEFTHLPVLLEPTIEALHIKPDGIYVDGTVGGAGHSRAIASRLTTGKLIALDRDPDALSVAKERLADYPAEVVESNFKDMDSVLDSLGYDLVDGILLDLGVSSFQLDAAERGFSYHKEAPLDMRMSKQGATAADIIAACNAEELAQIFKEYGEERFAYRIACRIEQRKKQAPFLTTTDLAETIASAVPAAARRDGHPARRCFQALRIAVNGELDCLKEGLNKAFDCLKPGGVLAIITFHSLEDRMVKQQFKQWCTACTCPPDLPVCVCGKKPKGRLVNRKAIEATPQELERNARSRSAKLRAVERLSE